MGDRSEDILGEWDAGDCSKTAEWRTSGYERAASHSWVCSTGAGWKNRGDCRSSGMTVSADLRVI
jgi:hypothetical protein